MSHPYFNPAFSNLVLNLEGVTLPDTSGAWADLDNSEFFLNPWARIVLGAKSSVLCDIRVVQGAISPTPPNDVVWLTSNPDAGMSLIAGRAAADLNDAATIECGFAKGKIQVKTSDAGLIDVYVQGRASS